MNLEGWWFLVNSGKPIKVALVGCCRKLIIMLNAMMRDRKHWAPQEELKKAA